MPNGITPWEFEEELTSDRMNLMVNEIEQEIEITASATEVNATEISNLGLALDNKINKTGDVMSGLLQTRNGRGLAASNLVMFSSSSNTTNPGIKIKTNLSTSQKPTMVFVNVRGVEYSKGQPIDITIVLYYYGQSTNYQILAYGATSINSHRPEIKIGFENEKLIIHLKETIFFNTYTVDCFMDLAQSSDPVLKNWAITEETLSPTAQGVIIVPYRQ